VAVVTLSRWNNRTIAVTARTAYAMYARSLAWLTLLAAVAVGSQIVSVMVMVFVHGNAHVTPKDTADAVGTVVVFAPLFGLIAAVDTVIVFTLPQSFQALVSGGLARWFGGRAQVAVLMVLPMTALITWYAFDYLIPSYTPLATTYAPDWQPYQHGLTPARYLGALAYQTPATLFSVAYVGTIGNAGRRRAVLRLAFAAAVLAGGYAAYGGAFL
jgi:hypothetical protein